MLGVFLRMQGGFGPMNLRAVGIILIGTFAAILAVSKEQSLNASVGILSAIAGYLFGYSGNNSKDEAKAGGVSVSGSTFEGETNIAGRDLIKSVESMKADIANISQSINTSQPSKGKMPMLSHEAMFAWDSESSNYIDILTKLRAEGRDGHYRASLLVLQDPAFILALKERIRELEADGWLVTNMKILDHNIGGLNVRIYLDKNI